MICITANNLILRLEAALVDAKTAVRSNPMIDSYLGGYLCVLASGIYEQCIEDIVGDYASIAGTTEVESYVRERLNWTFQNPKKKKVITLLASFSPTYAAAVQAMPTELGELENIVKSKNDIAHGTPCVVTVAEFERFHTSAKLVVEKIDEIFLGP